MSVRVRYLVHSADGWIVQADNAEGYAYSKDSATLFTSQKRANRAGHTLGGVYDIVPVTQETR